MNFPYVYSCAVVESCFSWQHIEEKENVKPYTNTWGPQTAALFREKCGKYPNRGTAKNDALRIPNCNLTDSQQNATRSPEVNRSTLFLPLRSISTIDLVSLCRTQQLTFSPRRFPHQEVTEATASESGRKTDGDQWRQDVPVTPARIFCILQQTGYSSSSHSLLSNQGTQQGKVKGFSGKFCEATESSTSCPRDRQLFWFPYCSFSMIQGIFRLKETPVWKQILIWCCWPICLTERFGHKGQGFHCCHLHISLWVAHFMTGWWFSWGVAHLTGRWHFPVGVDFKWSFVGW